MAKSHLSSSMKKATIELLLLKHLSENDMYGYQLSQELKKRSGGRYVILEGSMYPILYRLAESHYITFSEQKAGTRLTRVYYHLEPEGYAYLEQSKSEYHSYLKLIDFLLNSADGDLYEKG